jgi:antitoxin (DNA-binding transcriptional repressor) of toxin-antitoxin stability system
MKTTATMFEAKTNLSALVKKAQAGETIIITSGREKTPVAKLSAIERRKPKRLGVCYNPKFKLPADFFEPDLDGEE